MKKISIISICLLIFVVGIGCASAADCDAHVANDTAVDVANDTTVNDIVNIDEANDIDTNISFNEDSALDIEPFENNTPTSSDVEVNEPPILNITGPINGPSILDNIPGSKIEPPTATSHNSTEETVAVVGGIVIVGTVCVPAAVFFYWWWKQF